MYYNELESKLIDIVINAEEFTTSDLQGIIGACVRSYNLKLIADLRKIKDGIDCDNFTVENITSLIEKLK